MANSLCDVLLTSSALPSLTTASDTAAGAVVEFRGVVREMEDGRAIEGIVYEAHQVMAEHQMRDIARHALAKFQLRGVTLHHRDGFVPAGEASLFLRVSSAHRGAAFAAAEWIVEELKRRVPIWKRPRFRSSADGREAAPRTVAATTELAST